MMYSSLTIDYIYVGFDSTYRGVLIRFSARLVSSVAIANANIGDRYRKACVNPFANVSGMVVPFNSAFTIVDVSFAKSSCAQSDYSTQCLRSTFVISERIDADRDASYGHRMIDHKHPSAFTNLLGICADLAFVVTFHRRSIRWVSAMSSAAWSFHEYQERL